jgi:hypothetical protein
MDLTVWLPAMYGLGLVSLVIFFLFLLACEKI